jgi:Tol biopolymer transport system component/DNA-binding winged helix-turn-helix (wHTH) protein
MSTQEFERRGQGRGAGRLAVSDFRIADRLVRPGLNRIVAPHTTIQLEPKVMHVLVCLAERPGEVVTKERLFEEVWESAFVTEDVLTRAIGELRRAFDDAAAKPRVIETIRKSGYRLIAPVAADSAGRPPASQTDSSRAEAAPGLRFRAAALLAAGALTLAVLTVVLWPRARGAPSGPLRIRPLTSYPGNERDPAVSPDGSRVAFVWNGGTGEDYSLYVKLIDAETQLRLTREPGVEDRAPVWSPDGQRLAFTRVSAKGCEILLVSALGGATRPLAPCGDRDFIRLAWSPDGRWLAHTRRDARSQIDLELLSPETLERRTLTHPPPGVLGDSSPVFSPDGRSLAFARNVTDGLSDIYRVPLEGGEPTRLTFDNRDTMGADWSADGRSIVFSSSRAGIYSLWRVPASGGEPVWVAGGGMKMKHPATARSKNVVAFENWLYEVNLWRVPTRGRAGAGPARVTETTDEWNYEPSISPDSQRIAFVSTRSGNQEIWISRANGEFPTRLTSFEGARLETPVWSPDGKRILFSARRQGAAQVNIVDAVGGVPEQLTEEATDAVAPAWSRDGRRVYFASRRSGSWQVWTLELESRRLAPVTTQGGYASRESPDGKWLFFTRADAPGIWRQSAGGGPAERVFERLRPEDWANWQAGASGLYFRELCAKHAGPAVAFLAYGAAEPVDLLPLDEQGWSDFDVSRDGEWIVYPRVDRHTCDIRLIENAS